MTPKEIKQGLIDRDTAYHKDRALRVDPDAIKMLLQDDFMDDFGHAAHIGDYEDLIDKLSHSPDAGLKETYKMRITKRQLRRIIKEEKARLISEQAGDRAGAFDILDELRGAGVPDEQIVDYIIGNHLPGATAFEVMNDARDEFLGSSPWQESDDDRREREEEEAIANL